MYDEATIRKQLIASCHSSQEAKEYFLANLNDPELLSLLVKIALDAEDHGGDAPMQAAYFTSQFPNSLLVRYEPELFGLLTSANGYGGHVALALGKTRSARGKEALVAELGDGSRFDAWLFNKALAEYGQA
ncbi:hypothetical protein EJMOOK_14070 [Rhodanobacter sp. Root179]|nr:hypothetical protein ASD82_00020 [Rhodanobacter sp. Root179]